VKSKKEQRMEQYSKLLQQKEVRCTCCSSYISFRSGSIGVSELKSEQKVRENRK
jgi:hypothetical protein